MLLWIIYPWAEYIVTKHFLLCYLETGAVELPEYEASNTNEVHQRTSPNLRAVTYAHANVQMDRGGHGFTGSWGNRITGLWGDSYPWMAIGMDYVHAA